MNAKAAANFLAYIMSEAVDDLTNMKMNKLLYYAQGYHLKKHGTPLFGDPIEAWEHGPVIPNVYAVYKKYGDSPIKDYDAAEAATVPAEAEEMLFDVARKYGRFTASKLRSMTHAAGTPWAAAYKGGSTHTEISIPSILSYFNDHEDITPVSVKFTDADFVGYRDADGILVLPKDWDDGEV